MPSAPKKTKKDEPSKRKAKGKAKPTAQAKKRGKTQAHTHIPGAGPSHHDPIEIDSTDSDNDMETFPVSIKVNKPMIFHDTRDCIAYVYVSKPTPPVISRTSSKVAPPIVAERGPFFFSVNSTFPEFCELLAGTMGCRSAALDLPSARWKYLKPKGDSLKALCNKDGYKAMNISVKERTKDLTIEIHISPPLILANSLPYETDDYKPPDSFDELDIHAPTSVHQQIATLDASAAPVMEQLRELYPIGNHPSFPNKRIITSPTQSDRHWELTDIRTRVWAAHILQNKATLKEYPKSAHFSEEQRIRPGRNTGRPISPALAAYPTPPSAAAPAPPASNASDLLLLLIAQQMTTNNKSAEPTTASVLHTAHVPPPAPPPSLPPSPAVAPPRHISIHEFCERYKIASEDEQKLVELQFVPGDRNITKLERGDWEDVGFKRLGWMRILDAHKKFVSEVRMGIFQ
ncbi:hypothetical protein DFH07DRAFT_961310 [Mycena maculata]|uniref:Uncharacterized protein n=1 Tax=Mycena maculata TaxID=230809 RepID=A0AAD7IXN7_9AGAR|nr:hypothetical protein DFH07DRAFT_961310 [Mycena maculata]